MLSVVSFGHITMNDDPRAEPIQHEPLNCRCELIPLNMGSIPVTPGPNRDPLQLEVSVGMFANGVRPDVFYYYTVMWIEWDQGMAYRRAVGRVLREVWDSQQAEKVEVILG